VYRKPAFIRSLQRWIHLGTKWVHGNRVILFLTELDTFGYQVGTGNQHLSVLYRGEYIWVSGEHLLLPTSPLLSLNHPWKTNAKDGEVIKVFLVIPFIHIPFHWDRLQYSYPRWWKQSYDKIFRWSQPATWICTSLRWRPETGRIF
jgi:hypothetical protein